MDGFCLSLNVGVFDVRVTSVSLHLMNEYVPLTLALLSHWYL